MEKWKEIEQLIDKHYKGGVKITKEDQDTYKIESLSSGASIFLDKSVYPDSNKTPREFVNALVKGVGTQEYFDLIDGDPVVSRYSFLEVEVARANKGITEEEFKEWQIRETSFRKLVQKKYPVLPE